MSETSINRRQLLGRSAAAVAAGSILMHSSRASAAAEPPPAPAGHAQAGKKAGFKLGLCTYQLAENWDLKTMIDKCREVGIDAVELRTGHKHGVEPKLSKSERQEVRKQCADGGLKILSLGSTCEYHATDPAVVAKNIEETKRFIELAADLGAKGVKVRPNGIPKGADEAKTLEQIGKSLRTCGEAAAASGIEIWCEIHGGQTSTPSFMRKIMDVADLPSVGVTWNSNRGSDDKNGSVKESFRLMRDKIKCVHINELVNGYPYRELFSLLNQAGYDRYALMEVSSLKSTSIEDTVRFMKFYKALWEELARPS